MDLIQFVKQTLKTTVGDSVSAVTPTQLFATCDNTLTFAANILASDTPINIVRTHLIPRFKASNNNNEKNQFDVNSEDHIILLVLVVEAVRKEQQQQQQQTASALDALMPELDPLFSAAIRAFCCADAGVPTARFVHCCVARMISLRRIPISPFLAALATADEAEESADSAAATAANSSNAHLPLPLRLVFDIVSETAHTPDLPADLGSEILSVVLAAVTGGATPHFFDSSRVAELCRRVLIPLLNSCPELRTQRRDDLFAAVKALATDNSSAGRESEAILLIAALFDTLVDATPTPTGDLRSSTELWDLVLRSLRRLTGFGEDPSIRANLHGQVIYLLKRIVAATSGVDDATANNTNNVTASAGADRKGRASTKHNKQQNAKTMRTNASAGATAAAHAAEHRVVFDKEGRFFWNAAEADRMLAHWQQFFVAFETLAEYSTHIVEPAVNTLKQLWAGGHIHPVFVEAALFRAMTHNNVGVRRLALSLLWSFDPAKAAADFSVDFLAKTVILGAGDPRLCQEVDRAFLIGDDNNNSNSNNNSNNAQAGLNLLSSGVTGSLVSVTPPILSTVMRLSHFMCSVAVALHNTTGNNNAEQFLLTMIAAVTSFSETPRFCLALFCRVFRDIAHALRASPQCGALLTSDICNALTKFLCDAVHGRHAPWMEVRFTALICEAVVVMSRRVDNDTAVDAALLKLLAFAGPLGEAGGHTQGPIDACGVILPLGSAMPLQLLRQFMIDADAFPSAASLPDEPKKLVENFINARTTTSSSNTLQLLLLDVAALKTLCFTIFDSVPCVQAAISVLASLADCPEKSPASVVRAAGVVAEFCAAGDAEVFTVVRRNAAVISSGIRVFCSRALAVVSSELLKPTQQTTQTPQQGIPTVSSSMQIDAWDALCAALFWALRLDSEAKPLIDYPALWSDVSDAMERIWIVAQSSAKNSGGNATAVAGVDAVVALEQLRIVWERNSLRFVQCAAAGISQQQQQQQNSPSLHVADPQYALKLVHFCLNVAPLRTSIDAPSELLTSSGLSWGTVAAQHYRATWNSCLVFLSCAAANPKASRSLKNESFHEYVSAIAPKVLEELDCCASTNLSCIFDVLALLMQHSLPSNSSSVDFCLRAARLMRDRVVDGYRRERLRCAAIFCFAVSRCPALPDSALSELLLPLLSEGEEAGQRVAYVVAQAVAERSLRHGNNNQDNNSSSSSSVGEKDWLATRELLLHIAFFCNPAPSDLEETDAIVAAMEPVLLGVTSGGSSSTSPRSPFTNLWQLLCRKVFPPTMRMTTMARATAITALHAHAAHNTARAMWIIETLFDWSENHSELVKTNNAANSKQRNNNNSNQNNAAGDTVVMINSTFFRNRLRLWQLLTSLARFVQPASSWPSLVDRTLRVSLCTVNAPSIRKLMEGFVFAGLCMQPSQTIPLLLSAARQLEARPFVVASYLQLVAMVALRGDDDEDGTELPPHFEQLAEILLQYCSSHQHMLRLVSGLAVCELVDRGRIDPASSPTALFVTQHPECLKFRARYRDNTNAFRIALFADPRLIFCVQRIEGHQWLHDAIPAAFFRRATLCCEHELRSLLGSICVFDLWRGERIGRPVVACMSHLAEQGGLWRLKSLPLSPPDEQLWLDYSEVLLAAKNAAVADNNGNNNSDDGEEEGGKSQEQDENEANSAQAAAAIPAADDNNKNNDLPNLQRKTAPWWQCTAHNELAPRSIGVGKRQSLIIVASLLDNPVNVASLFRSSEIFAAEKIIISDKRVTAHPHFVAAARSSDAWMPFDVVPPAGLPKFFREQRDRGYTICAIEQTAESISMEKFAFSDRVVLVLGAEQTGMPPDLLGHVDVCVEIPQFGLIRSLNVASTGTLVIWEFTKQKKLTVAK